MSSPHFLYPYHFRPSHPEDSYTPSNYPSPPPFFVGAAHRPWSKKEMDCKRRVVQLKVRNLPATSFQAETTNISCIYWEQRKQHVFTSADFFKLVQFLFKVQLDDAQKKFYRRCLDKLDDYWTIDGTGENRALFYLVVRFPDPKPTNTKRSFKVFPWACIDMAVENFLNRENTLSKPRLRLPEWVSYDIPATPNITPTIPVHGAMEGSSRPSLSGHSLIPDEHDCGAFPFLISGITSIPQLDYSSSYESEISLHPAQVDPQLLHISVGFGQTATASGLHGVQNSPFANSWDRPHSAFINSWSTIHPMQHPISPAAVLPSDSHECMTFPDNSLLVASQEEYDLLTAAPAPPSNSLFPFNWKL